LRVVYSQVLPSWQELDIAGSPYAIGEYEVLPELGGENALRDFRHHLNEAGMKLVLDFVPNHFGLDCPWIWERPELFVQTNTSTPETFRQSTAGGAVWLAHGKDPYFAAWTDTVQLDYRRPVTRSAMTELLLKIADRCDGVRCDMAMLLLNEVFAKTWERFPSGDAQPTEEFWQVAIAAIKQAHGDFTFIAEAYWGTERRLQALGFDYTYVKAL
jgi:glycosidase